MRFFIYVGMFINPVAKLEAIKGLTIPKWYEKELGGYP